MLALEPWASTLLLAALSLCLFIWWNALICAIFQWPLGKNSLIWFFFFNAAGLSSWFCWEELFLCFIYLSCIRFLSLCTEDCIEKHLYYKRLRHWFTKSSLHKSYYRGRWPLSLSALSASLYTAKYDILVSTLEHKHEIRLHLICII